ncbi:hypothetical protein J3R82DRAFT_10946 [Butyriboletus roseoflavus]|nr:hypothetical protein J3R82DRAFT_10946 [Butyriboletus roseoflavus]
MTFVTPQKQLFMTSVHVTSSATTPGCIVFNQSPLIAGSCAQILIQHCLACFGGSTFGRNITDGGDIHVAMDGNFHHCHCCSAGDSPSFYEPVHFLPNKDIDAMSSCIAQQWKKPLLLQRATAIPDKAIDLCEASYEAMDGKKQKTSMKSFDDMGLMALICHHDILLFFANIDTPGEQQKYALTLIAYLFFLLPPSATVVILYDMGCKLDRTLSLVGTYLLH